MLKVPPVLADSEKAMLEKRVVSGVLSCVDFATSPIQPFIRPVGADGCELILPVGRRRKPNPPLSISRPVCGDLPLSSGLMLKENVNLELIEGVAMLTGLPQGELQRKILGGMQLRGHSWYLVAE